MSCANWERESSEAMLSCVRRRARVKSLLARSSFSSCVRALDFWFRRCWGWGWWVGEEVEERGAR